MSDTIDTTDLELLRLQTEMTAESEDIHEGHIQARMVDVHTALPGIIVDYDSSKQTCSARPAIRRIFVEQGPVALPVCSDVPVFFPGGVLTFDVSTGDDCLLCFSERCIDGWFKAGGVQDPSDYRMHDLSDGFAFVGFESLPHALQAIGSGVELRTRDGSNRIALRNGLVLLGAVTPTGAELTPLINGVVLASAIEPLTELTGFMLGWSSQKVMAAK